MMKSQSNNKDGEIKFAIRIHPELYDDNKEKMNWFLYHFQKGQKNFIPTIIEHGKEYWNLDPSKEYSLIMTLDETQNIFRFITDEQQSRSCFTQGAVLELYYSVGYVVSKLIEEFKQSLGDCNKDRLPLLKKICIHASDQAFVAEFDKQNGFQFLISSFVADKFNDFELCYILDIIAKIMEHDIIKWTNPTIIEKNFIERIIEMILNNKFSQSNSTPVTAGDEDRKILIHSLSVLESAILNGTKSFLPLLKEKLPLVKLCRLLEYENHPDIQQNVLALINALLQHSDAQKRRDIFKIFKETLMRYVVNRSDYGSEITHQLYVLQTLMLRCYEEQLYTGATPEQTAEKWKEIRKNYDSEMDNLIKYQFHQQPSINGAQNNLQNNAGKQLIRSNSSVSNKSNSFNEALLLNNNELDRFGLPNNGVSPTEIFADPPGLLILNLLCYYSGKHNESFVRFIVANQSSLSESRSYDCPLIVASFRILSLIVELLGIGKPPRDEGREFYPMLLKHEEPLEEFFSIGLSLFNRTWHDIHATSNDIDIACDFLAEKFHKILNNQNATVSFDNFLKELSKISYAEISRSWREARLKREQEKEEMPAIKELRNLLKPEMIEIVKQNRLNYLIRGTRFDKYTNKGQRLKDKFWYCRLSSNHKTLLYGDVDEDCKNLDEKLVSKFDIADAGRLVTGKECPHMRDSKGKKSTISLAFAIIPKDDDASGASSQHSSPLCFVAGKSETYDYWIDGLNSLLNQEMNSTETKKDVEMLLDLDVKLRLLDIEGLKIPDRAPELPPSPPDYDFEYRPHHHTSLTSI